MSKLQTFQEFLATQNGRIPAWGFALNILLAAILTFLLARIYIKYGNTLSNRRMFAGNFMLVTVTTTIVIAIVKSSLALSLGLVGALSIVRFRAAIKEPEELAYLFLAIAIGLGLGADQRLITIVGFALIAGIIWLRNLSHRSEEDQNLYLTISSHNPVKVELKDIVKTLKTHCSKVDLKRFEETKEILEATFLVEFDGFSQLEESRLDLQKLNDSVRIIFIDRKGIG